MNNMIGKSGFDWRIAPNTATHKFKSSADYYKKLGDKWVYWNQATLLWQNTRKVNDSDLEYYCLSKEEDLKMNKKVVSKIDDLEVGMFFNSINHGRHIITKKTPNKVCGYAIDTKMQAAYTEAGWYDIESWSYIYDGVYTHIIKETESDLKIKELEQTINSASDTLKEAQKQLQQLKGSK